MEICFLLVIKSKIKVLSGLDPEKGSLFGLQMAPMSSQAFPQCVYLERERSLSYFPYLDKGAAAAAAKLLQLCLTLCDPIDGSPSGSTVPGILQAKTLERVAISFSDAWKWKWKLKWSHSVVSDSSRPHGLQPTRLLHPWDFPGMSTGMGCHCLLWLRRLLILWCQTHSHGLV